MKKRNKTSEERYMTYKSLFKTLKKKSKKSYYSNLIKILHKISIDEKEIVNDKTIAENSIILL